MPTPTDLPKLAPDCVIRHELEAWLERNAAARLRIVAAQPGAGKTAGVARWARRRDGRVAWISVPAGATRSELCALLMIALSPGEVTNLDEALVAAPETTLVVDGADAAAADAIELLAGLPERAPAHVALIYLMRSAAVLDAVPAARADAALLRFDESEIERLLVARGLAATPAERQRLLVQTGGWSTAVAGTIRYAAAIGGTFELGFDRWLASSRSYVDDLVVSALNAADPEDATAFTNALAAGRRTDDAVLERLAHAGLFVELIEGTYVVNPVVAALEPREDRRPRVAPALVHVFGRFRMTIGDREVAFMRRRDRQLVQFLALRADGCASRAELAASLWPDAHRDDAAQALRAACTTIRRAIGEVVGRANVSAYFHADATTIGFVPANVTTTLQRFRSHVDLAASAQERGATDEAYAHWSAALTIHAAPLLAGEPEAPWIIQAGIVLQQFASYAAEQARMLSYVEAQAPVLSA
ncbi:MAG TPA: hypothetical protein VGN14_05415 [Candidatus Elarobacter sp.]|jgi:hypothetical protein